MIENGQRSRPLVSSDLSGDTPGAADHDLVRLKYSKVQKDSPEFQTVWEGVDQTIAVELSTFNFTVAPVPVLSLYDFIMTTFVPKGDAPPLPLPTPNRLEIKPEGAEDLSDAASPSSDKIRIRVKLTRARSTFISLLPSLFVKRILTRSSLSLD
jgi:vacuolar protein sorting-associated protein 13A/C